MRKTYLLFLWLTAGALLQAQEKMYIHLSDKTTLGASLLNIEEMFFSGNGTMLNFSTADTTVHYAMSLIDSISFAENSDTVFINFSTSSASVINPFAFDGVTVSIVGACVTIKATEDADDMHYKISGTTTNGMLKINSEKKCHLALNNVNITNPNGPAINIQAKKKVYVTLLPGTTNSLTDGDSYEDSIVNDVGETEEQDAAFFSEGSLIFDGSGSLIINGKGDNQHALCSDDLIEIHNGTVLIASAAKDGIHTNDGVIITEGTINVNASGDAIDGGEGLINISGGNITTYSTSADVDGMKCDSTMTISGGTLTMTVSGDQSKGLKSDQEMRLIGGEITLNTSGNVVLETDGSGYDPSYCSAIKCNDLLTIDGANLVITTQGKGGKGLSSNGNIDIISGSVDISCSGDGATYTNASGETDAYSSTCITADGNINIVDGTVTVKNSGTAGKGIKADGALTIGTTNTLPEINISTTGAQITISTGGGGWPRPGDSGGEAAEAKAISCDGDVTINNGSITISSADDGIKSTSAITINNGTVSITKSVEGIEAPLITVNNGDVSINSSDDGFNATYGNGGEGNDGSKLYIKGGNIVINVTNGDGLDSNGDIVMTGGTVVVHGPTSAPEVGLDYNGTFNISGGLLLATGPNAGRMIEATSTSSSQYTILATSSTTLNSALLFHITDATGNGLVTYKPVRNVYYVVFSSSELKSGSSYSIYTGGTSTGTYSNGIYVGGSYSGGTLKKSFTVSGKVTEVAF